MKEMDNLLAAQFFLNKIIKEVKQHRELEPFYKEWHKENKGCLYNWQVEDISVRDKLIKYEQYYPTRLKNMIVIIRRLLNEGKGEI